MTTSKTRTTFYWLFVGSLSSVLGCQSQPPQTPRTVTEGGVGYSMPSADAEAAERYDVEQPSVSSAPRARCVYWTRVASDVVDPMSRSRSAGLKAWSEAKRTLVCKEMVAAEQAAEQDNAQRSAELSKRQKEEDAAEERKFNDRLDKEISAGRCDANHIETLRRALSQAKVILDSRFQNRSAPELWDISWHEFVVATATPTPVAVDAGIGGEVHVIAVGFAPSKLTVTDRQGYPVKTRSDFAQIMMNVSELKAVGLEMHASPMQAVKSSISGRGCVLVFAARKD